MIASLMLLLVSASIPTVKAAPEITLTPTTGEPYDSVELVGTGFAPDTTVGIGVGAEIEVMDELVSVMGEGGEPAIEYEPWFGVLAHRPIKPKSFNAISDVDGVIIPFDDEEFGNGTCTSEEFLFYSAHINYTSGIFQRVSSADLSMYDMTDTHTCNYIHYEADATPDTGIRTDSTGAFTVNITVPLLAIGPTVVTAIDELGNVATSGFEVIPEGLSFGVVVILLSLAIIIATLVFRKRSKIDK